VHLIERECTIQRRHQKITEEAPSATLNEDSRHKLLETALHIAKSMHFTSAGTLEFLFDKEMNFYFLEMNTRIQVEHPVTEAITGIDIVKEQIKIAQGQTLGITQNNITINGYAIECRIYAEDPFSGFMPSAGEILHYHIPEKTGIRIDSAFTGVATVSASFDPMIAKVTAHAQNREECIYRLQNYLKSCVLQGIKTNLEYLLLILNDTDFQSNNISTSYCAQKAPAFKTIHESARKRISKEKIIGTVLALTFSKARPGTSIWKSIGEWRFPGKRSYMVDEITVEIDYQILYSRISFSLDRKNYLIEDVQNLEHGIVFHLNREKISMFVTEVKKETFVVYSEGFIFNVHRMDLPDTGIFNHNRPSVDYKNGDCVLSPLNGRVIKLNVKKGDKVKKGALLMIIESMKMENNILSPSEAIVSDVMVSDGDQVTGKELLIKLSMVN
jgi:acetyl/propionyl-CoA carboxylase alpha subunit